MPRNDLEQFMPQAPQKRVTQTTMVEQSRAVAAAKTATASSRKR